MRSSLLRRFAVRPSAPGRVVQNSESLVQELRAGTVTKGLRGRPTPQKANELVHQAWRSWKDPNEVARALRALVGTCRDEGSAPDPAVCLDMLAYLEEHITIMTDLPGLVHSVGFISTPVGVLEDPKLSAARDRFLETAFERLKRRHGNQWKRMDMPLVAAVKNYRPQYHNFIMAVLDTAARELTLEFERQHSNLADSLTRLPVFLHAYSMTKEKGHPILDTTIKIMSDNIDSVPLWVVTRTACHLATILQREPRNESIRAFYWCLRRVECVELAEVASEIFPFYTALWRINEALQEEERNTANQWMKLELDIELVKREDIYYDGFALETLCVLLSETRLDGTALLQLLDGKLVEEDIASLSPPALIQSLRLLVNLPSEASTALQRRLADHISRVQWLSPDAILELSSLFTLDPSLRNRIGDVTAGMVRAAARELYRSISVVDDETLMRICSNLRGAMKGLAGDEMPLVRLLIEEYAVVDKHVD
ncbi:hypothetical protein FOL47_004831 [Perkinsus chesapeaki]|uniref:Uncharacterized protein n=1 Tax=Perkinsus chesapeaki TaxID=330153 RepID=A0A7J6M0E4_PERCH|nr:hypothetical protein FOL47_004831 [Perkinsus chesapeaki]